MIASKKHDELQLFSSSRNQKTPHVSTSAMQSNAKHNFFSDRPTADHVIIGQRAGPKLDQGKCEASEMCALERPSPDFCATSASIFPPTEGFI